MCGGPSTRLYADQGPNAYAVQGASSLWSRLATCSPAGARCKAVVTYACTPVWVTVESHQDAATSGAVVVIEAAESLITITNEMVRKAVASRWCEGIECSPDHAPYLPP